MKFICGNCGELIRESDSPMAFEGWQVHEACGHETFFDKFVVREREKDKQPVARRVRPIGDKSEGVSVGDHKQSASSHAPQGSEPTHTVHAQDPETGAHGMRKPAIEDKSALPSAADLDAVAREQEAARATADDAADAKKAVDEHLNPPVADVVPEGGVNEPRKKGKGAK